MLYSFIPFFGPYIAMSPLKGQYVIPLKGTDRQTDHRPPPNTHAPTKKGRQKNPAQTGRSGWQYSDRLATRKWSTSTEELRLATVASAPVARKKEVFTMFYTGFYKLSIGLYVLYRYPPT